MRAGTGEDVDHFLINSFVHLLGEMGRWDGGDLWLLLTAAVCSLYPSDPPLPLWALQHNDEKLIKQPSGTGEVRPDGDGLNYLAGVRPTFLLYLEHCCVEVTNILLAQKYFSSEPCSCSFSRLAILCAGVLADC